MKTKTLTKILIFAVSALFVLTAAVGVKTTDKASAASVRTLKIANCEDYIYVDEDTGKTLADTFAEYYKETYGEEIRVEYSTFSTPEDLYTNMKINPSIYDVMCPSDYMIEKMAREGMLQKITLDENGAYNTYVSPFIKEKFEEVTWTAGNGEENLSQYAAGYMWGTLGLVYNAAKVNDDDMTSWSSLWSGKFDGKFTIKDSVRDSYFITLAKVYEDELKALDKNAKDYGEKLTEIFNRTDAETVGKVKTALKDLKSKCWGLEVDSGKNDVVTGKIDIYFAWSGDAVYAMDEAEEEGVILNYSVPDEGSNIWFDGWCVAKNSQNADLAKAFIDYISMPENVINNMDYIGYVSCIGGEEVFDYVLDTYDDEEGDTEFDLSYFFKSGEDDDAEYIVKSTALRQLSAQYPSLEVINRCAVMNYFADEANSRINDMWTEVSTSSGCSSAINADAGIYVLALFLAAGVIFGLKKTYDKKR